MRIGFNVCKLSSLGCHTRLDMARWALVLTDNGFELWVSSARIMKLMSVSIEMAPVSSYGSVKR